LIAAPQLAQNLSFELTSAWQESHFGMGSLLQYFGRK
jgi:hypothetical protein